MLEKRLKQIPMKELIKNRWYLGRGRNSNIGYWDGNNFLTIAYKFDIPTVKIEPYYEERHGCFQPFLLINEGEMIDSFGDKGWEKHYGKLLLFKLE
jgi:hypothetical protein